MFPVTVCEADSTTSSYLEATVVYASDCNNSSNSSKSDYYQHSEPKFVEDLDSESEAEYDSDHFKNQCQGCNPKVLTKTI